MSKPAMRLPRYFQTLTFRLILFGVCLVIFSIGFRLLFVLPTLQEQVRELAANQQMAIATYVAHDIDHKVGSRLALIGTLAGELPTSHLEQLPLLREWLRRHQHINPLFNSGLMVVAADGRGLLGEYPQVPGRAELDYREADWFQAALRSDQPAIGKARRGRATGDPLIIMAAPVRDHNGKTVAVIAGVALLNAPGFLDLIQETRIGAGGGFLLISPRDQLFVAASDPAMILQPTPAPGINPLHDRAMAGFRGVGITTNAKGVENLAAFASVPSTGWFVVARLPTAEAFRPIHVLRELVLSNSLVMLAVLLGLMLFVLPRLFRPLTEAARAMRRMADGQMPLQQLPISRRDEIGDVLAGFNHLVARLLEKENALKASEAKLDFMAHHDPLTSLPNRALLEDRLEQALARSEREGSELALLFCDLDGFKPINDQYGHDTGDQVLRQVGERLLDGRRRVDTVARLGGDEFVILLADLNHAHDAARLVAEQCLAALAQPFEVDEHRLSLGMSIGIAIHKGASVGVSHLLSQADSAMYEAKRAGKGRLAFFTLADSD